MFEDEFVEFPAANAEHFGGLIGIDGSWGEFGVANELHECEGGFPAVGEDFDGGGTDVIGEGIEGIENDVPCCWRGAATECLEDAAFGICGGGGVKE